MHKSPHFGSLEITDGFRDEYFVVTLDFIKMKGKIATPEFGGRPTIAGRQALLQGYALSNPERRQNDWVAAEDGWVIFETHKRRRGPVRKLQGGQL